MEGEGRGRRRRIQDLGAADLRCAGCQGMAAGPRLALPSPCSGPASHIVIAGTSSPPSLARRWSTRWKGGRTPRSCSRCRTSVCSTELAAWYQACRPAVSRQGWLGARTLVAGKFCCRSRCSLVVAPRILCPECPALTDSANIYGGACQPWHGADKGMSEIIQQYPAAAKQTGTGGIAFQH